MKKSLICILLLLVLFGSVVPATAQTVNRPPIWIVVSGPVHKISRSLEDQLKSLQADETITVIVQLRQRANLPDGKGLKRGERLSKVIDALKKTANGTQGPVRLFLKSKSRQGSVKNFTPLWILNGFSVTASPAAIDEIAALPDVLSITPDEVDIVSVSPAVPALSNPEQNISLISAPLLWNMGYTGQGVVMASLDSGVDVNHPDLAGRWRGGTNSWFDPFGEHPTTPVDRSGHGTWTMGVMLGGDAGGSSVGVAPGAQWIAARIFNDQGGSSATAIHQSFQWLLDPDGDPLTADAPQVVNNSWAFGAPGCNLEFEPDLQSLRAAGILPVFAAGNSGPNASTSHSPANNPSAFAVGAINNNSLIYGLSSRGPTDCGGSTGVFPDVVAPGVNVNTTDLGGFYTPASGTSLSAPHVSGGLALLLSAYPNLPASQQEAALRASAIDLGITDPDDTYGFGRLDLFAAFQWLAAPPTETPAPLPTSTLDPGATETPTDLPSFTPTPGQTETPTDLPTFTPTILPTDTPTALPTFTPTLELTNTPTALPTFTATPVPTNTPTALPTFTATSVPTNTPTAVPTNPPASTFYFSTSGNSNPPGVSGTADDADIYYHNGSTFSRVIDASGSGSLLKLPSGANIDGFDRVDATHFYLSFKGSVTISGLGTVQDEDVVFYNTGTWSLFFDGSVNGLGGTDLDAINIVGGILYFSTDDTDLPPGAGGSGDDADIYVWNGGSSYTRVVDASGSGSLGLPGNADVDGFVRVDATHFYLSFLDNVNVPVLGTVQDEDVVYYDNGTWSVYFDGTAPGLTSSNLDVDAFDLP
jgi:subtilisin family serine protease